MTWSHIFTPFNPGASPMLGLHSVTRLTVQNTGILFANQDAHAFWSGLGSIFASPSLQGLRISNLEVVDSSPPSDTDDCTIAASSLRVLLSSTKLPIKHISISLPHFYLNQHASSVALCPWAGLSSALQTIRSTLQVLELHASAVWWHHQALSKMHAYDLLAPIPSLKDFKMLRALKVPFRAIISIDDDDCGISITERLPDDLEEIWFADDGFPAEFSVLFKNLGFVRRIFEDKQKGRLSKLKRVVLLGRGWDNEWENGALWKSVGEEVGIEIKMVKQFKDRRYSEVII
ncbi:hypothetical protein BS50DRAFT_615452 [Corynespora cassiicola Philippines]|uniref:Uncharacterized protein n=1 Tax=Corynespora cassiicola Philippines TaxID=1448308 RepID=A0A2T2PAL2_CORCC|nr:hypothetical protein BS50DRAFT_615452 [Corynespora cassiicola Philippines]